MSELKTPSPLLYTYVVSIPQDTVEEQQNPPDPAQYTSDFQDAIDSDPTVTGTVSYQADSE